MACEVEYTNEFELWWIGLTEPEQISIAVQHAGDPYRVFYAFDPRRAAMLLIGGCKAGDDRFYERMVPWADRIYEAHLQELENDSTSRRK